MTQSVVVDTPIEDLLTEQFDFDLPPDLIAQTPLERRDASRLMVLDRQSGEIAHRTISALPDLLDPGDLLIANNSRVLPARLRGVRLPTGGAVEVLLLRRVGASWSCLARPAKRLKEGAILEFPSREAGGHAARALVEANIGEGEILLQFEDAADERLSDYGFPPLPPYIVEELADGERYQTVYGTVPGSAAAPTAGLHFTRELLDRLAEHGISWAEVTLHVGLDTFRPVTEAKVADHQIHQEWCTVPLATSEAIARCRQRGGRVMAVGTTAARTLETIGHDWDDRRPRSYAGWTGEFIVPGHEWRLVEGLLTNFHLPRSSLILLVSALAGREAILNAYAEAIAHRYRFFSFGDAMLIR